MHCDNALAFLAKKKTTTNHKKKLPTRDLRLLLACEYSSTCFTSTKVQKLTPVYADLQHAAAGFLVL
jgi:hypothetical protein